MDFKLSIIIPCYNAWSLMRRCLEALEYQTKPPYEIIIWDDCSKDGSYNSLLEYSKKTKLNIKVFRNDKNSGPSVSRKKALDHATGTFIAFCDADDWYEDNFVESVTECYKQYKYDLLMFNNYRVRNGEKRIDNVTEKLTKSSSKCEMLAFAPMSLCRIVVQKSLIDLVKFNELFYGEDGLVLIQLLLKAEKTKFIASPFYNYYMREGSAHYRPRKRCFSDALKSVELYKSYLGQYPDEYEFIAIKNFIYGGTLSAFKAGISNREITEKTREFKKENPNYIHNKYLDTMGKIKKTYVICVWLGLIPFCRVLSHMHTLLMGH